MLTNYKRKKRIFRRCADDFRQPLSDILPGQRVEIVGFDAGKDLWTRLESMGLFPGSEITVLTNHSHGPILLALGEKRIMLGRGMAERIIVQSSKKK